MSNLSENAAKIFAKRAHEGQLRKYTLTPYITHPANVVNIVKSVDHTPIMICAAWLHDVVEDTPVTIEEIESEFGVDVATMVAGLTDVSGLSDGNRDARKSMDRSHTASQSPDTKTVKIADLIDNSFSITKHDAEFAKVYMREKELLLEVLREGNSELWDKAMRIVCEYKFTLIQ
jgi:(p)ppGpp synthase/HD superfamily hydrolase